MNLNQIIEAFLSLSIQNGGWMELDCFYLKNRILLLVGEKLLEEESQTVELFQGTAEKMVDELINYALANKKIENDQASKNVLKAQLFDLLMPPPAVVNAFFAQYYSKTPQDATDYFYQLNRKSGYVKKYESLESMTVEAGYGEMTFKLMTDQTKKTSETAANEFAAACIQEKSSPQCPYCFESEGYAEQKAENSMKRFIRMNLQGESWGFQFATDEQYSEQFFISPEKHSSLEYGKRGINRMTQILDVFPHYFISLKDDGSIRHGCYEGGKEQFPLFHKSISRYIELADFPLLNIGTVYWPFPVIRLQSPNKEDITEAAAVVLNRWEKSIKTIEDNIFISIIGRRKEGTYEFDLLFTNADKTTENREIDRQKFSIAELSGVLNLYDAELIKTEEIERSGRIEQLSEQYLGQLMQTDLFKRGDSRIESFEDFLTKLEKN
ncbi:hypothetical protein LI951_09125 [Enterococcus sp. BWT-B8]|uniref:hypothetical protein n=1 Tax=Enterococcus sp. BWT-B8 TaxID=2885157 RepID=UPI001E612996|nr:hypothetical protein [Enterococcus sp. BWT-B8]MCB5952223.1 hypothetical protein [Enterococcus sp. BWT-B8]